LFPKNKYPVIKSEIFNELGRTYEKADRFRKALVYYKKALNCLAHKKSIKLKNEKTNGYNNNIASIYSTQRKFNKALDLYNQILNSNPDIIGKAFINLNIATILFMKRDFENAFMKCKLAIQLAGDIGDYTLKALFLTRLSLFYDQQGDYRNALKIQEETQHIYILINSLHGMAISLLNQGASLSSLGNRKDAIEKYKKALNIFTTIKDTKKMAELNHYIAGNYYEQMDILNAHQFETKAYEIACKHNYIEKIEYKRYLDLLKNYQ